MARRISHTRKRRWQAVSVGAAMADMAMLLLVFFMATTSTEPPKGVEVELPRARTEGVEQDSIYISMGRQGRLFYEGRQVSPDELKDQLMMRRGEKDRVVALTADKNLEYSKIKKILDVLREVEFLNVVFMSEPRDDKGKP